MLILFHGCNHDGSVRGSLTLHSFRSSNSFLKDWFNGPAERRIVAHALAQGFITIAMQCVFLVVRCFMLALNACLCRAGARHGAKCWHNDWPVVINNDVIAIRSAMEHFFQHPMVSFKLFFPLLFLIVCCSASRGRTFRSTLSVRPVVVYLRVSTRACGHLMASALLYGVQYSARMYYALDACR